MTILDPITIYCPQCRQGFFSSKVSSIVTNWVLEWSDWFMVGDVPPKDRLIQCQNCGHFYWFEDAECHDVFQQTEATEAELHWLQNGLDPEHYDIEPETIVERLYEALQLGVANTIEREISIRLKIVQIINNLVRVIPQPKGIRRILGYFRNDANRRGRKNFKGLYIKLKPEKVENLEKLNGLLRTEDNYEKLIKIEVLRELGRFGEALQILQQTNKTPDNQEFIALSLQRIRNRNSDVFIS